MTANGSQATVEPAGARTGAPIEVRDLEFRFGRDGFTLQLDELTIAPRERVALVGPSGCGKTTLLHVLAGILVPLRGTVRVGDTVVSSADDRARRSFRIREIGLVFQNFELLDYLRVLDNVLLPYRLHPALRLDGAVRDRARELATSVGIGDKLGRGIGELSQGERQRVAICRALVTRPSVVLADEPTGNLDPATTSRIVDVLFESVAAAGSTLVVVTHDHGLLDRFDRVVDLAR